MKYKTKFILNRIIVSILFLTSFQNLPIFGSLSDDIQLSNTDKLEKYTIFDYKSDDYLLGSGDVLSIRLSKSIPELEQIFTIDGNGLINLPEIERIYVKGLTTIELEKVLEKKYKNILKNPDIEIQIFDYRPINVYLMGEVEEPGMYSFLGSSFNKFNYSGNNAIKEIDSISGTIKESEVNFLNSFRTNNNIEDLKQGLNRSYFPTIFDLLRKAGGVTNYSDLTNLQIIRHDSQTNGGGKKQTNINFLDVIEKGDFSKNLRLYDNDMIIVKRSDTEILGQLSKAVKTNLNPKYIRVFVSGRITQPGVITIPKSSTLSDAINVAGGPKVIRGKTTFIRYNVDGSLDKRIVSPKRGKRGSFNNPYLKSGDIIRIGKGPINTVTEILTEITAPFAGAYTFYSILEDIGGN